MSGKVGVTQQAAGLTTVTGEVTLPTWTYEGDESLVNPNNQALTIPANATIVEIGAEDGVCYFAFGGAASAASGGYMPDGGRELLGPLTAATLTGGIRVHAPAATVHVLYFSEG